MPSAFLIYNPVAGRYPSWLLVERTIRLFTQNGWEIRQEPSTSGEHVTQLAYQAAREGMDALFIVGGDGTMNHALPGLMNSQTALGVLPAGTANVWAQELGLASLSRARWNAIQYSASLLAQGVVYEVDVGECNGRPFLLWAGVGLDGYIVHRIEPRNRWEKNLAVLHYGASAIWYASQWRGMNIRIEADGQAIDGHYLMVLASNITLYAGGLLHLSHENRLDDGQMELWMLEGESMGDTIQRVWDLTAGQKDRSEQIRKLSFKQLILESDSALYVQLDGEPWQVSGRIEIRMKPKALRVLVPSLPHPMLFRNDPVVRPGEIDIPGKK
jgi:YegS/Rv2252/BmrU family lipid kinase